MKLILTLSSIFIFSSFLYAENVKDKNKESTPKHTTKNISNESSNPKASLNIAKKEKDTSEQKNKIMLQGRHGRTAMARERLGE